MFGIHNMTEFMEAIPRVIPQIEAFAHQAMEKINAMVAKHDETNNRIAALEEKISTLIAKLEGDNHA